MYLRVACEYNLLIPGLSNRILLLPFTLNVVKSKAVILFINESISKQAKAIMSAR